MSNIIPKGVKRKVSFVVRETTVSNAMNDALTIIHEQINRLAAKSNIGQSLEPEEVKNLRTFVQSLVDINRDQRDQEKHDGVRENLESLSDQELLNMYKEQAEKK